MKVQGSAPIRVSNDELMTVREAMRFLNQKIDQLQGGEINHVVLMKRGRMVARIIPIEENDHG